MSIREDIINDVVSTLTNITVAGGYNNDIAVVTRETAQFEHFDPATEYPAAIVVWGIEPKEGKDASYFYLECDLDITIRGAVYATTGLETALNNFLEDVEKVLCVDDKRGGNAAFTAPSSITVYTDNNENILVFDYVFLIRYYYPFGSP